MEEPKVSTTKISNEDKDLLADIARKKLATQAEMLSVIIRYYAAKETPDIYKKFEEKEAR